jgi:peptidoglycan/LPS O-acetylase OafA/YrhL/lysophospholipase L1-like esterase
MPCGLLRRVQGRGGIPHMPALDGLRGLAVLAVVAFHASGLLVGGYLGVDLFFVLSGFLITSILLREQGDRGRIDLRAFWIRRARRLLPALLTLMPAVALYAIVLAKPHEIATLRSDALATLGYVANWRAIYAGKSYWEIFAAPSPLEHTWSLAIEEQFYLLWPLMLVLVVRLTRARSLLGRRVLFALTVGLAIASAVTMFVLWTPERASRVYMGSDTRAGGILAGAALAMLIRPGEGPERWSDRFVRGLDIAGGVSAIGLAIAWTTLDGQSPRLYHGGFWLTELFALVLIACALAGSSRSIVAKVLALRPLVFVGVISYGVYLWHWPVDVVLTAERTHLGRVVLEPLRVVITFAIALASYRWIEQPIRSRGVFFGRPAVVVPSVFAVALALVLVTTRARAVASAATIMAPTPPTLPPPVMTPDAEVRWPDFNSVKSNLLPYADALPAGTTRVLVLGDSVAQFLGEALRFQQADAKTFVAQRGVGACSIHEATPSWVDGKKIEGTSCADTWVADVDELRPDVTFIVLGGGFLGPRTCQPDWRHAYGKRLTFLLRAIASHAGRIILALVPYPGERWRTKNMLALVDCFNDELGKVADAEGVSTIDLKNHVCPTTDCILMSDGHPIRNDGLHFDGPGAAETARWTLGEIRRLSR